MQLVEHLLIMFLVSCAIGNLGYLVGESLYYRFIYRR
jgi:hypothetical protein